MKIVKCLKIVTLITSFLSLSGWQDIGEERFVGNGIGRTSNTCDSTEIRSAWLKASRSAVGDTVYWRNGRTGHWGYFCPLRDGHTRIQGDYCREFMSSAYVNGKTQRIYGTACRRPNGTWYGI